MILIGIFSFFIQILKASDELKLQSTSLEGDFYKFGKKYGTDKITHHFYYRYYPQYIERFRELSEDFGLIEIGIDSSYSLRTWLDYFPKQFVYGIDIKLNEQGERYLISNIDQSKKEQLVNYAQNIVRHKIFFIIDDGSHVPEHQILTFDIFFKDILLPGGVYIIEDIETSYWKRGAVYGYPTSYGINHPKSAVEIFKKLIDYINAEYLSESDRSQLISNLSDKLSLETLELIKSISFGANNIIITKKTEEEIENYKPRKYRFSRFV
jgi:hypothetical protein